jgi:hypothetical protein
MICGVFTITQVPASQVNAVMQGFRDNSPPPVSVASQPDGSGTFTVVATFPPCEFSTTHDTGAMPETGVVPLSPTIAVPSSPAPASLKRGSLGIDSFDPVSQRLLGASSDLFGRAPVFWGRYFHAPGQINSSGKKDQGHYSATEGAKLREHAIRVLPIARQTGHVGRGSADGVRDAERNVDAVFEVFPPSFLQGADPDVLVFLDCETGITDPHLSPDYYAGWARTIVQKAAQASNNTVRLHPAIYASHSDAQTWKALRTAVGGGTPCAGAWVAAWVDDPSPLDWSDARTMPTGGLPCPILAWQYSDKGDGGGFDTNEASPAHEDIFLSRLVMPPP